MTPAFLLILMPSILFQPRLHPCLPCFITCIPSLLSQWLNVVHTHHSDLGVISGQASLTFLSSTKTPWFSRYPSIKTLPFNLSLWQLPAIGFTSYPQQNDLTTMEPAHKHQHQLFKNVMENLCCAVVISHVMQIGKQVSTHLIQPTPGSQPRQPVALTPKTSIAPVLSQSTMLETLEIAKSSFFSAI